MILYIVIGIFFLTKLALVVKSLIVFSISNNTLFTLIRRIDETEFLGSWTTKTSSRERLGSERNPISNFNEAYVSLYIVQFSRT